MSDIDETTGRLSPPHLDMLWKSAGMVGPGDVRDLIAEVRRLRHERDSLAAEVERLTKRGPLWMQYGLAKLHAQVDLTDPDDPVGIALTVAGFERVPMLGLDEVQAIDDERVSLRARACRHPLCRINHWDGRMWVSCDAFAQSKPGRKRCVDCGHWLPLGPANDDSEAVRVEIDAARIVAAVDDGLPFLAWFADLGSLCAAHNGWLDQDTHDAGLPEYTAGYLARAIVSHDDGEGE